MDNQTDLLTPYQWKNRILVIFSKDRENDLFQKQMQIFTENKQGLQERDLIIFQVFKENDKERAIVPKQKSIFTSEIEQLKKRFGFSFQDNKTENEFAVFLVGKDGATKLKTENEILSIDKLFGTIDSMPMRKSEIRKDKK